MPITTTDSTNNVTDSRIWAFRHRYHQYDWDRIQRLNKICVPLIVLTVVVMVGIGWRHVRPFLALIGLLHTLKVITNVTLFSIIYNSARPEIYAEEVK